MSQVGGSLPRYQTTCYDKLAAFQSLSMKDRKLRLLRNTQVATQLQYDFFIYLQSAYLLCDLIYSFNYHVGLYETPFPVCQYGWSI